ncbi:MAG: hypothetical protein JRD89_02540 [Deltaproteobacteria bacterium]|nr:hypothetical protein [Deltaproteobacteria bacterium]
MYHAIGQAPVLPPEGIPAPPGERPLPGTKGSSESEVSLLERFPPLYVALGVSAAASLALTGLIWGATSLVRKKKKGKKGAAA